MTPITRALVGALLAGAALLAAGCSPGFAPSSRRRRPVPRSERCRPAREAAREGLARPPATGRPRHGALVAAIVIILLAVSSCSGNGDGGQVVFELMGDVHIHGPVHTAELYDNVTLLTNVTGERVHLVSVSLASPVRFVRFVGATAFDSRRLRGFPVASLGDLPVECPKKYIPAPVSSVVVRPHQFSPWFVVVTIRIMRPGRYVLPGLRIDYTTPSGSGWQYYGTNTTLTVSNPPLPGPRAESAFQACLS